MPPEYVQIFHCLLNFFTILPFGMLLLEFKLVQMLHRPDGETFWI